MMTTAAATTTPPPPPGLQYHAKSKALHLRLDKHEVLLEVSSLLRHGTMPRVLESQSLHLSLTDALLQPPNDTTALHFLELCSALSECLVHLKEIHIGRALSGFLQTNVGAWCPVEAIQLLLGRTKSDRLVETIMLRNLQVYTLEGDTTNPINTMAEALHDHPSLQSFGWQHCEFATPRPSTATGLDPLLQSLSTIPNLNEMVIQCPPWAVRKVPTECRVLRTILSNNNPLKELHLEGLHLQDDHVRSLLLQQSAHASLQTVSLAVQLTLGNIQSLGTCLAQFLQHRQSPSLRNLGLRLEWLVEGNDAEFVTRRSFRRQRLQALQRLQDTLAHAVGRNNPRCGLQRLDLIYYDSSSHYKMITTQAFHEALETNDQLTHLRLPYCGEMDTAIDFMLKVNRTGLRRRLLRGTTTPSLKECVNALIRVLQSQHPASFSRTTTTAPPPCWNACRQETNTKTALSMAFYLLREMPMLFI